jgi:putative ABC transport system permease protein
MRNNNQAVIKKITKRCLKSNKKRNLFIIMAIMLTTLLITSIFSIGMSIFESLKIQQVRIEGSASHAAFPQPSIKQLEKLKEHNYVKKIGTGNYVGIINNTKEMGNIEISMAYFDEILFQDFHVPAWKDIVGHYPRKANEIMVSRWILEKMGITNPELGMSIQISYKPDDNTIHNEDFILSGYYTSYEYINSKDMGILLVSNELSQLYNKSIQANGSVNIIFKDTINTKKYIDQLKADLELNNQQPMIASPVFNINFSEQSSTIIALLLIIGFFMFAGYLLIYNVLYISVARDIRFFGLLKAIGTTPKQIRQILIRQVIQLCIIGIPLGTFLAGIISFIIVPLVILSSNIKTGAVISFSPIIFIGAALFSFLTALIGAMLPARKASNISPIEAVRYTGETIKKKHAKSLTYGKPYRMAYRNIFRNRKRACIVLLSLFLGLTIFQVITTLVSSIDIEKYVTSYVESDFLLENNSLIAYADRNPKFTDTVLQNIESLSYLDEMRTTSYEWYEVKYKDELFGPHLNWYFEENKDYATWPREQYENNFTGIIHGIDKSALLELNESLTEPIDLDAFERGEYALISTDDPSLYDTIRDMEITCLPSENTFVIPIGGVVPYSYNHSCHSVAPTLFVSNTLLQKHIENPLIYTVNIDVSKGYDEDALNVLKDITNESTDISITSRFEARQGIQEAKTILYILGVGTSLILGIIGILNFINVMTVGIVVRKREFATLESVGMSRKQIRRMLVNEGIGYSLITLLLVSVMGNIITLCMYYLFQKQTVYLVFSYPFVPLIIMGSLVFMICLVTPEIAYRSIAHMSIVERLRESE